MAQLVIVNAQRQANAYTPTMADAAGDTFANTGAQLLLVEHTNQAGSAVTLTIATTLTIDGEAVNDKQIVIAPGEKHLLGPFPPNVYNDANGNVVLSYSSATDIDVTVIQPS